MDKTITQLVRPRERKTNKVRCLVHSSDTFHTHLLLIVAAPTHLPPHTLRASTHLAPVARQHNPAATMSGVMPVQMSRRSQFTNPEVLQMFVDGTCRPVTAQLQSRFLSLGTSRGDARFPGGGRTPLPPAPSSHPLHRFAVRSTLAFFSHPHVHTCRLHEPREANRDWRFAFPLPLSRERPRVPGGVRAALRLPRSTAPTPRTRERTDQLPLWLDAQKTVFSPIQSELTRQLFLVPGSFGRFVSPRFPLVPSPATTTANPTRLSSLCSPHVSEPWRPCMQHVMRGDTRSPSTHTATARLSVELSCLFCDFPWTPKLNLRFPFAVSSNRRAV